MKADGVPEIEKEGTREFESEFEWGIDVRVSYIVFEDSIRRRDGKEFAYVGSSAGAAGTLIRSRCACSSDQFF